VSATLRKFVTTLSRLFGRRRNLRPMRFKDIVAEFRHVDDPDVLEKARSNPALEAALELTRPANWRGAGLAPEQVLSLAERDGIPIAWVPPSAVLKALVAAGEDERHAVLRAHRDAVVAQCVDLVEECDDPWISDSRTLVQRALAALKAGHHEAAMALAVAVGEPLALWASEPRVKLFESEEEREQWEAARKKKYSLAATELSAVASPEDVGPLEVVRRALIAPIPKFFTPYYPDRAMPVPETLSRHLAVHQPTVAHFSETNALLAVMLATSLLREQQAWCAEVRTTDAPGEAELS
jgi:hypothetical protein